MIKLTFLGDALWDWPLAQGQDAYGLDFTSVFAPLKKMLAGADYTVANLETTLSEDPEKWTNCLFTFCTPAQYAAALRDCGVSCLTTGNNHCLDRGLEGIADTIACLDKLGIPHVGTYTGERKPPVAEAGGMKIGILSYTYGTNAMANKVYLGWKHRRMVDLCQEQEGMLLPVDPLGKRVLRRKGGRAQKLQNWLYRRINPDNDRFPWYEREGFGLYRKHLLKKDLRRLKKAGAEKIVIYLHIGGQYNKAPNGYTLKMTRWLEKKGVDFIIANHEHVVHGSKLAEGQLTTYSIGNLMASMGTVGPPEGYRAEYSVAVHGYVGRESRKTEKVTYSVLRVWEEADGKVAVWPVYDLLPRLEGDRREKVYREALECAKDFSGKMPERLEEEMEL